MAPKDTTEGVLAKILPASTFWKILGILITILGIVAAYSEGAGALKERVANIEANKLDKVEYQKDKTEVVQKLGDIQGDVKAIRATLDAMNQRRGQ